MVVDESGTAKVSVPTEEANEGILGHPKVTVTGLKKTFGHQIAVNNLSFKMYENQIFALLGHNGAGTKFMRKLNPSANG